MKHFLKCLSYLAGISLVFFFFGRILPQKWFHGDSVPFRPFPFEKDGAIYHIFGVRKRKDGFPDMSVAFPSLMPPKKLLKVPTASQIAWMIQETCIAELVHSLLCVLGFGCIFLWRGMGGWILSLLYAFGNLPYIIIQRYNRPKYLRLLKRLKEKDALKT